MTLAAILWSNLTWIVLSSVTLVLLWRWLRWKRYNLPPGPYPVPFFGNALTRKGLSPRQTIDQWRAQYGPVFLFYLGPNPTLVIANMDALNEAYVIRGEDFSDKPSLPSLDVLSDEGRGLPFAPYTPTLVHNRRMVVQALRHYLTGDQLQERVNESVLLEVASMTSDPSPFDPRIHLIHIIFNVLHGICFGSILDNDDPFFIGMIEMHRTQGEDFMGVREDMVPILRYIWPSEKWQKLLRNESRLKNYIVAKWKENMADFDDSHITNFTQNLILAKKQTEKEAMESPDKPQHFTERIAYALISDVFFAGTDTTRRTLEWIFMVLAHHQDIQEKVYQEIKDVIGESVPGRSHRPKLNYLEAVINETLRLFPVTPFGLLHMTSRDTKLTGYDIPKKTLVLSDIYTIQRDPKVWDEPSKFKPERFLDADGHLINPRPRSAIAFNIGPRSCVGESLARNAISFIVAGILQKVKVSMAAGEKTCFDTLDHWFLLHPDPYKIQMTLRR